jgi:hypothetical protein
MVYPHMPAYYYPGSYFGVCYKDGKLVDSVDPSGEPYQRSGERYYSDGTHCTFFARWNTVGWFEEYSGWQHNPAWVEWVRNPRVIGR